jgi:hypothetical protein
MAQEIIARFRSEIPLIKKLLHSKRDKQQGEETAYRMVENLCQLFI